MQTGAGLHYSPVRPQESEIAAEQDATANGGLLR
jgi:hypothetical protein